MSRMKGNHKQAHNIKRLKVAVQKVVMVERKSTGWKKISLNLFHKSETKISAAPPAYPMKNELSETLLTFQGRVGAAAATQISDRTKILA